MENYNTMLEKFNNKKITETEWTNYCMKYLEKLMVENKATLIRLKNI